MFFWKRTPESWHPLEWLYTLFIVMFTKGLFLDGWAHIHIPEFETFFTPWHAVFYAGYLLSALTLVSWTLARRGKEQSVRAAIPPGYELSLLGAALFLLGGVGDMAWHEVFGAEADIEALLSPTHLALATGMLLMLSGPYRSWAARGPRPGTTVLTDLPLALSLALSVAILLFLTQFAGYTDGDAVNPAPAAAFIGYAQSQTILGALLLSAITVGALMTALRRGPLPFGTVTILLAMPVLALGKMRYGIDFSLTAALLTGIGVDVLLRVRPAVRDRRAHLLLLSFAVPAAFYLLQFLLFQKCIGLWWTVHLWTGLPVMAGAVGLLTAMLALPASARR